MPREVFFATPTFSGHPSYEFCGAMWNVVSVLLQNGIDACHRFHPGLQFVEVARNILCTQFLQNSSAGDLFFIDDDVGGWPPQKVLQFLNRPEPVICGVPPFKQDSPNYPVQIMLVDEHGRYDPMGPTGKVQERDGLYRVSQIPMGFCRIKRHVIEHFAAQSATYAWAQEGGKMLTVFDIFRKGPRDGEYVGEDMMFAQRCIDDGIEMWVDPDIDFRHRGSKSWDGNFKPSLDAFLRSRPDLVAPAHGRAA